MAGFALWPLLALSNGTVLPTTLKSDGGTFQLSLTPSVKPLPFNQLFELNVDVSLLKKIEDPNPFWIDLQTTMPGHGHGMNTRARIEPLENGRFIVRGLLLHMTGEWEFTFDVAKGRTHEKAIVRFVLE